MQQLFRKYKIIFYKSQLKNIRKAFTKEKSGNDFLISVLLFVYDLK